MDFYEEKALAVKSGVCPKCGSHLDLVVRVVDGCEEDFLVCCNVKCRWECMPDVDGFDAETGEWF